MTQILWTKPVCQLDENGIFIGMAEADLDVYARDGSYLIPAGCIDTEPPELRNGYAAKWVNTEWQYLPDLRGQTAYNTETGEAITIEEIGELSAGLTLLARPDECHDWINGAWKLNKDKAKAKEFSTLSAAVAGQRQHYADLLAKAKNVAAVDAINPIYQV